MIILSGKEPAYQIIQTVKNQTKNLIHLGKPGLATILVGQDPASQTYIQSKKNRAIECGFEDFHLQLNQNTSTKELVQHIQKLNLDSNVHGILVQQPLPNHIDTQTIVESIHWEKDVDGFHPHNMGLLAQGFIEKALLPCTPWGILKMLQFYKYLLQGKHVVIIGRSNIVGRPLSILLSTSHPLCNATVTLTHSKTQNLREICLSADLLIAAIGKPHFVIENWVKKGAWVIDVGINRVNSSLCGDVDFQNVQHIAGAISPVPGGVGLMTVAMLMANTLRSFKRAHSLSTLDHI